MLSNFLREYNINRILLSIIGLWPFQSNLVRNLLRTVFFLLQISFCPFEILMLYDHWDNAEMIFEGCYQLVVSTSFIARQVNEFWNHDKYRHLYKAIDEHWDIFTNDVEIQILKDYSKLSQKFTKYYCMLMCIMTVIFITIPLTPPLLDIVMPLNESRPRFFALVIDFKVDKDKYFLPLTCYITAGIMAGTNIVMSTDTMHIACTLHACSLFVAVG
ncbi:uncharacterized protein LOC118646612 [Monomorium pharaonis]|uniref:uncharacterized protein LOC118646612 n=1 Tax=Monomorium pharaonis TaxID=307658 RepID=UPI001745F4F6|nr:uncharacterized protein LOC118646612 [Monomorium pharaonis]